MPLFKKNGIAQNFMRLLIAHCSWDKKEPWTKVKDGDVSKRSTNRGRPVANKDLEDEIHRLILERREEGLRMWGLTDLAHSFAALGGF
jgi:hypothetical protein